jgi:superfamily II DNA or RNA helicase
MCGTLIWVHGGQRFGNSLGSRQQGAGSPIPVILAHLSGSSFMLIEQEIAARQERAQGAIAKILARPNGSPYGDYHVKSASGKDYRVALRGPGLFENYCSCPDFAVNTLGTCKHVESLLLPLRKRHGKELKGKVFARSRASVSLHYGETLGIRLRLPALPSPSLRTLARKFFDTEGFLKPEHIASFGLIMDQLRNADDQAVIYSDVLEYVGRESEIAEGFDLERKFMAEFRRGRDPLAGLLKTDLLPYQVRGAIFAACRGRVVLADDMGLGKTVQALAATEMLRRHRGISKVLVVAPASVKYQWKKEIERFTGLTAQLIEGLILQRQRQYASPVFFNLTSYELVLKDVRYLHELKPDLIILDEAQRIRNWATATARTIKQLKSRYVFVLTGTPLENKLEELFSVVEFVDGRRLGPAFRFLQEHRMEDENGKLLGYRGLDQIHHQLEPILLRRTRREVLKDLPERTDQIFRVPLTEKQAEPYWEQSDILAGLMRRWEAQGWLSEIDQRRIMCCLQNMRMLCDSTFLFDKHTHHSPKLAEFREIIRELALEENRKVVVFSEYERMTYLAGEELRKMGIGYVSLHGGVPSRRRGKLIEEFDRDPGCRVFLSTDAGGVGLNLQVASAVINFEPPWNPARLEQRIGRVHRLGQKRPVQVVHLLTQHSIEERVWETLNLKKSLFAGIFDSPTSEVSFAKLGRKSMMQAVKEIFAHQPVRLKPVIQTLPPQPISVRTASPVGPAPPPQAKSASKAGGTAVADRTDSGTSAKATSDGIAKAAVGLLEAGLTFLESLGSGDGSRRSDGCDGTATQFPLSALLHRDRKTKRTLLSIPLPPSVTQERLGRALAGLVSVLQTPR